MVGLDRRRGDRTHRRYLGSPGRDKRSEGSGRRPDPEELRRELDQGPGAVRTELRRSEGDRRQDQQRLQDVEGRPDGQDGQADLHRPAELLLVRGGRLQRGCALVPF